MTSNISKELLELKAAYSDALWAWAQVEAWLFVIFFEAHGGQDETFEYLQETFFSVVSFELRLTMTHNVAKMRWEKHRLLEMWQHIYKKCEKENRTRGKFAHLVGDVYLPNSPNEKPLAVLIRPYFHPRRPQTLALAKVEGYQANALLECAHRWNELSVEIHYLSNLAQPPTQP